MRKALWLANAVSTLSCTASRSEGKGRYESQQCASIPHWWYIEGCGAKFEVVPSCSRSQGLWTWSMEGPAEGDASAFAMDEVGGFRVRIRTGPSWRALLASSRAASRGGCRQAKREVVGADEVRGSATPCTSRSSSSWAGHWHGVANVEADKGACGCHAPRTPAFSKFW